MALQPVDFVIACATGSRTLTAFVVLLRSIGLICRGHLAVALENLALRQQLASLTRTVKRPQLRQSDRLFWIRLARAWREWRTALIVVQPDTVVRWHRQWLRRRWSALSCLVKLGSESNPVTGAPEPLEAAVAGRLPPYRVVR
jgi:hypothetical protein